VRSGEESRDVAIRQCLCGSCDRGRLLPGVRRWAANLSRCEPKREPAEGTELSGPLRVDYEGTLRRLRAHFNFFYFFWRLTAHWALSGALLESLNAQTASYPS
jgi:hypothetical protein